MSLEQLFGGRLDLPAAMERLSQVADSLGLPLGRRSETYNSRNAQELGLWVAAQGGFSDYLDAVYRAYFVEGVNIARPEELLRIIDTINLDGHDGSDGLDAAEARRILETHSFAAAVDQEWDQALSAGITAVPTLRYAGRELIGFQSIEACRQLLGG